MPKAGSEPSLDGLGMPLWLVLELTYKCPLKCPWCNNPVDFDKYRNELTTDEWKAVLREGRRLGALQLGFSGGEPMLRPDLEELVGEADRLGYYTNLITSGVGLNPQRLAALKAAGLKQVQLSLQACDSELNAKLVGLDVWAHKIAIARDGTALPCQEARLIQGVDFPNVRDGGLDWIWKESPGFQKFRGDG